MTPPENTSSEGDGAAIARVLAGDAASFEVLMRRYNQRVFRAVRSILKSDEEAEDAMQQAYISAFTHLADFGGRSSFSTWLVRIAIHEALARVRRQRRLTPLDDETLEESDMPRTRSPEDAMNDLELRTFIEEAVDALPVPFSTVFVLRAVEDLSVGETAEALGITEETVRSRLHRARHVLRERLEKKLEDAAPAVYGFHLSRCDRVVAAVLARIRPV